MVFVDEWFEGGAINIVGFVGMEEFVDKEFALLLDKEFEGDEGRSFGELKKDLDEVLGEFEEEVRVGLLI